MFVVKAVKFCRPIGLAPAFMTCWLLACSGSAHQQLDAGASDLGAQGGAAALSPEGGASAATGDGAMPAGSLRFDGLYQHPQQGYTTFLRFYQGKTQQSGNVYEVSATGTVQEVATWLKTGSSKRFSKGQYELQGSTISFLTSDDTKVRPLEFQGEVGVDQLVLQVHSLETDYRAIEIYTFVPLDLP
jgi:hypothetical protein